ncbi:adenylate/guanylate cyclase domain-containing protein, partial [Rhizobium ruizarguesonis]
RATPLPQLTEAGAVTGIASVDLSGDGAFRRIPGYEDGFAAMLMKASGAAPKAFPAGRLIQSFCAARSYPTVSYYQVLRVERLVVG